METYKKKIVLYKTKGEDELIPLAASPACRRGYTQKSLDSYYGSASNDSWSIISSVALSAVEKYSGCEGQENCLQFISSIYELNIKKQPAYQIKEGRQSSLDRWL